MRTLQIILVSFLMFFVSACADKAQDTAHELRVQLAKTNTQMFVIEREIQGAGDLSPADLQAISKSSCDVIKGIGKNDIEWLHSYVTGDKVYCVYMAKNEDLILEHAKKGGFPANSVQVVANVIDPGTASE